MYRSIMLSLFLGQAACPSPAPIGLAEPGIFQPLPVWRPSGHMRHKSTHNPAEYTKNNIQDTPRPKLIPPPGLELPTSSRLLSTPPGLTLPPAHPNSILPTEHSPHVQNSEPILSTEPTRSSVHPILSPVMVAVQKQIMQPVSPGLILREPLQNPIPPGPLPLTRQTGHIGN